MTELNRFDFFSDIEDTFVRLRGKALFLSNLDWELMEQWKNDGLPLHVVLRSIEEVFAKHKATKQRSPIGSLAYCKSEVEAQFEEWKSMRVGAHEESVPGAVATGSAFEKTEVESYLQRRQGDLLHARDALKGFGYHDALSNELTNAYQALFILWREFEEQAEARKLEEKLTMIERDLDKAIEAAASRAEVAEAGAAAEALFGPYKNNMLPQAYEQQIDNELKKRLREIFGVPRLSLFHMK